MSDNKSVFSNPNDWHSAAMLRPSLCSTAESQQRQNIADACNQTEKITDPDTLNDQQLYIQGKMDKDEYQDYLLFKHSKQ